MRPPKSRSRTGRLTSVFPFDPDNKDRTDMYAWMAVLCVLSQDLSLEVSTIYDKDFSKRTDPHIKDRVVQDFSEHIRQGYFLRRHIATLREFGVAVRNLDKNDEFRKLKARFSPEAQEAWEEAVGYFKTKKEFLGDLRNDIGGHFSLGAARAAMEKFWQQERGELKVNPGEEPIVSPDARIEYVLSQDLRGPVTHPWKLHFVAELATWGLLKHGKGQSPYDQSSEVFKGLVEAIRNAHKAVEVVLWTHLWDRFAR